MGVEGVLLVSMLMLLCRTMRDLAMVVRRDEEADEGIMEPVVDLRAVLAGVEGAEVTTGTSGFVGSSLVNVPWRIRSGSGEGATFAFDPPIAPYDGCRSRIFGMSVLLLLMLLLTDPVPLLNSSEFRFDPTLDRALNGIGRVVGLDVSTSELWLRNFGVANEGCGGAACTGVLAMTAGADTTVFRYGDTYAGFFVPRTVFTAGSGVGAGGLILLTIRAGVGILLGLASGDRTGTVGGSAAPAAEIVGSFCSKDLRRGVVDSWIVYVTGSSSSSGERTRSRDIGAGD